ncbi:MAG: tRNA 2-thiouridine(34) synthase MnmA [Puniceicoccaceae bacterium]|nr:MAG: tRNA 2-thiouridine(34) synthase MnmA [Puniceicoccaceae bacterium]
MSRERILVALSGGVDSAVAALLLREQGHAVEAAYMKNWINEENILGDCPWQEDLEHARAVCAALGIPFRVVNLMRDYRERVVSYLLDGYESGHTPNPDVMCNREIKFGVFLRHALAEGFDAVATGHYARRENDADGRTRLFEGADKNKDQSYFLALLGADPLTRARFPLGALTKPEVRRLAASAGLPNAGRKDSQGICFIGNVRMRDFLRTFIPDRPGPIVRATDGAVLGQHRGLHLFTIGQRRGIGIPSNTDHENYVVVGKEAEGQRLLVAFDGPAAPGLWTSAARIGGLRWLHQAPPSGPLQVRVRYRDPRVPATLHIQDSDTAEVVFDHPQRALATGQVIAFHRGEELLGGGIFL